MRQFLWEEVVAGLPEAERTGLLALAVLGSATQTGTRFRSAAHFAAQNHEWASRSGTALRPIRDTR